MATRGLDAAPDRPPVGSLRLLGGFGLERAGVAVVVPRTAQRLVAYLGVVGRATRAEVCGALWGESEQEHADGSLRTSLWRLRHAWPALVECGGPTISLTASVVCDSERLAARARSVLTGGPPQHGDGLLGELVGGELLPGWYDDWAVLERERLRLVRVRALEAASSCWLAEGRAGAALDAALAAVAVEPLRESAHRAVIAAHMAEGNAYEARRQLVTTEQLLREELGVRPSPQLGALARSLDLDRAPLDGHRSGPGVPRSRTGTAADGGTDGGARAPGSRQGLSRWRR